MRMTVYKQLMFVTGVGLTVLSLTESVYWSLGAMGLWMMILGPLSEFPPPRRTERLTFPQLMYILNNPSQPLQYPRCDLFIESIETKRLLKEAFKREEELEDDERVPGR